jgi:hypothetical protein
MVPFSTSDHCAAEAPRYDACRPRPPLNAVAGGRTPEEAVREVIEEANDFRATISEDTTIAGRPRIR